MKPKEIIALLAIGCLMAGTALAQQEQQERGQLWELEVLEVPPEKAMTFEEGVKEVVKLAGEHGVGSDYAWHFWSHGFDYLIASPISDFAAFDDPMAWMRQFGEEGGKELGEVFKRMDEEVGVKASTREIREQVPGWTYKLEGVPQHTYSTLYTFRLKPGKAEAFGDLAAEFVQAWTDMDYPYAISGFRTHFGNVGKVDFLIFYDDPSAFWGENSFEKVAERAGHAERYQQLLGKLAQHIDDMEVSLVEYHPELSYSGPATGSE